MPTTRVFHGNIVHTPTPEHFEVVENGYITVTDGRVTAVSTTPPTHADAVVADFHGSLIIPSFVDLHIHAPQLPMAGIGYDRELLPWLERYTFPLESRYEDPDFAEQLYKRFVTTMWEMGTLRFSTFATIHADATLTLMRLIHDAGLRALVGKVNMDRNAPAALTETTTQSLEATLDVINRSAQYAPHVMPIITPRFVPSVTPELMSGLGQIVADYHLPVQSHLAENPDEISWVRALHPDHENYADVYRAHGLLPMGRTIMAHCVHLTDEEQALIADADVTIAHCAQSNFDLASGIMPLRKFLDQGLRCSIASDVAGGHTPLMASHIVATIEASKAAAKLRGDGAPVSLCEAFFLATKAGGSFFGSVGSFEVDHEFDALVLEAPSESSAQLSVIDQLEQFVYAGDDRRICHRFIAGMEVHRPFAD